jgi:hypothetical protein
MPPSNIWMTGFNAFHQLSNREGDVWEFERFQPEGDGQNLDALYSSWSSTAVKTGSRIRSLGFQNFTPDLSTAVASPFGDDVNGLLGFLDPQGQVHLLSNSPAEQETNVTAAFVISGDSEAPRISNIATAGNGKVALTFKQAPNGRLTHIAEFASFETFTNWHKDPSKADNYPAAHHMLPGRPKQLLANGGNFILLMESGEVYTWGDPRFRTLARPTAGADGTPAEEPGLVEALGGLKIESAQCGPGVGWLASALSEDGALYLWGTTMPGEDGTLDCLREAGPGEVALVEILPGPDAEPADIVSAAIGRNHVAVVTDAGHLFVVGDNGNGQLGLGREQLFAEEWTRVSSLNNLSRVVSGPKSTFAFAD